MRKKIIFGLILVSVVAGNAFSQDYKHEQRDMYLGFFSGLAVTPNILGIPIAVSKGNGLKKGNYVVEADFGATFEAYLTKWLSVNTGIVFHPELHFNVPNLLLCLTVPVMTHINVPGLPWLYAGTGLSINIPFFDSGSAWANTVAGKGPKKEMAGVFLGIPIDIGFDFMEPGKGGKRLLLRITPEFHKAGVIVPIGIIWQFSSFKLM